MFLFVGIGAGAVLLVCLFQLRAARTLEQAVPWGAVAGQVGKFFPIAIIGLFGTGAYMTRSTSGRGARRWIDIAIVALVVLAVQGAGIGERAGHKLKAALMANGPGPLGPEARRAALSPGLWVVEFSNLGIVFGVVWNMTQKPSFGESLAAVLIGYAVGAVSALLIIRSSQEELVATAERRRLTPQRDGNSRHAARWPSSAAAGCVSAGSSTGHRSIATGQRGWKRQPVGIAHRVRRLAAAGSGRCCRSRGSRRGTTESSALRVRVLRVPDDLRAPALPRRCGRGT